VPRPHRRLVEQPGRTALASDRLLAFPGAFNPLSALLIEELGFDGVYASGAVISADLGLPDISFTTLTEVASRAHAIARVNVVIYPVTLLRLAMGAAESGLRQLRDDGTQAGLVPGMQIRARLYELLGYTGYTAFDSAIFDFKPEQRKWS
jgi:2-methylisocitrate lyase-like PEP mutase family enzyme